MGWVGLGFVRLLGCVGLVLGSVELGWRKRDLCTFLRSHTTSSSCDRQTDRQTGTYAEP